MATQEQETWLDWQDPAKKAGMRCRRAQDQAEVRVRGGTALALVQVHRALRYGPRKLRKQLCRAFSFKWGNSRFLPHRVIVGIE